MKKVYNILWGIFFGLLLSVTYNVVSDPVPYKKVNLIKAVYEDPETLVIEAEFVKTDCKFVRLETFGVVTGFEILLNWEPRDTPFREYDRSLGEQHLTIAIDLAEQVFDSYEIRTRHDCDGVLVDKVFLTGIVPDEE